MEKCYNSKVAKKDLKEGNLVLRNAQLTKVDLSKGKLVENWKGPYIIKKDIGNGAFKIMTTEGNELPRTWNADTCTANVYIQEGSINQTFLFKRKEKKKENSPWTIKCKTHKKNSPQANTKHTRSMTQKINNSKKNKRERKKRSKQTPTQKQKHQ